MSRYNEIGLDWWCHVLLHEIGQCRQVIVSCIRLYICCLAVVIRRFDSPGRRVKIPLHRIRLVGKISHFWSLLRHRCLRFILVCAHERLQVCVLLVVLLLKPLLRNLLLKRIDLIKFANSFLIQTIYALECSLPDGFLMVRQQESSEFRSLKEVFAMVLLLWHGQNFQTVGESVLLRWGSFHSDLALRHQLIKFANFLLPFFVAFTPIGVLLRVHWPGCANIRKEWVVKILQ